MILFTCFHIFRYVHNNSKAWFGTRFKFISLLRGVVCDGDPTHLAQVAPRPHFRRIWPICVILNFYILMRN